MVRTLEHAVTARRAYIESHDLPAMPATLETPLATYQHDVCAAYLAAENNSTDAIASYDAFAQELLAQWELLKVHVHVVFCDDDPTPLTSSGAPSFRKFVAEVEQTNVLKVYRSGPNDHTYLCERTIEHAGRVENLNSIFRAVHDYFGHLASGAHFGWAGETTAYYSHAAMFSIAARGALFTETVGQQCYFAVNRDYAPQRVVSLDTAYHGAPLA